MFCNLLLAYLSQSAVDYQIAYIGNTISNPSSLGFSSAFDMFREKYVFV